MPNRMNRDEFFAKVSPLDADQLRKALWTLYWRGTAQVRERIEEALAPAEQAERKRKANEPPPPEQVLDDVTEFVHLVREGAYMYGDRRVSRTERSKWRVTFRSLAMQAHSALHAADTKSAEAAMEQLVDLACEMRRYDYVHSEDPVEAARFVVSHAVAALWTTMRDRLGSGRFAERAATQLIRWESAHGWTRGGYGKVSESETSLAAVLEPMLTSPEEWAAFADAYVAALDVLAPGKKPSRSRVPGYDEGRYQREQRTGDLAEWNGMLIGQLARTAAEDRLDRLVGNSALDGPGKSFLRAQLAHRRGDLDEARTLIKNCLEHLPGSQEFLDFAAEIGADLPSRAKEISAERSRWATLVEAE